MLSSNLYLNEVDRMLERAKEVTRHGKYTYIEYARYADDLVVLIDAYKRHDWLIGAVEKRLREEFDKLRVEINDEKSRTVELGRGESFGFLGKAHHTNQGNPAETPLIPSAKLFRQTEPALSNVRFHPLEVGSLTVLHHLLGEMADEW